MVALAINHTLMPYETPDSFTFTIGVNKALVSDKVQDVGESVTV
jgi:hypothetical protein